MNSDRLRLIALLALPLLAGCEHGIGGEELSSFGEANRQTMAAQVIDPDPQYDTLEPPTHAEHAAQAIDRYRKDAVKKPDTIRSTQTTSGSGRSN